MIEFNRITLLYGLFSEWVFPEAKMNIDYLKKYFKYDPLTRDNPMTHQLLWVIETQKYTDLTEALFISVLSSSGLKSEEIKNAIEKIREYRTYTREQALVFRENLKRLCYKAYFDEVKIKYGDDLVASIEAMKRFDYKSNYSDTLIAKKFNELEITDLIKDFSSDGYKSRYDFINKSFTNNGYIPGQIIQVVAAPSVGKSLWLMGEAVNFINQGRRVHYLTLGDLNEADMASRMTCMMARKPKWEVEKNLELYYDMYKSKFDNKLSITVVPSGTVKVSEYVDWIVQNQNEYDVLMVDYDSNFAHDPSLNMYDVGGETYDRFTILTRLRKLVFVASQPKISYFGAEVLPLDAAGESSRKQHISDVIITIGRNWSSGMRMGKFNIAKSRRGENAIQPWIGTNEGLFYPCSDILYSKYRSNKDRRRLMSYDELEGEDILDNELAGMIDE